METTPRRREVRSEIDFDTIEFMQLNGKRVEIHFNNGRTMTVREARRTFASALPQLLFQCIGRLVNPVQRLCLMACPRSSPLVLGSLLDCRLSALGIHVVSHCFLKSVIACSRVSNRKSRSHERTAALYRLAMAHPGGASSLYQSVLGVFSNGTH